MEAVRETKTTLCGRCGKHITRDRFYIWSHVDPTVQHPPTPPNDRIVDLLAWLLVIGTILMVIGLVLLPIALLYYLLS